MRSQILRSIARSNVYVTRGSIELTIREANKTMDVFRLKDTKDVINSQKLALVEACGKTDIKRFRNTTKITRSVIFTFFLKFFVMAIELINGIPEEQLKDRRVRVYRA